jgi:hypothetical protein
VSKPATNTPKSDMAQGRDRHKRLQEEDSMSSHITPPPAVTQPAPTAGPTPPRAAGATPLRASVSAAAPSAPQAPVSLDTLPASPPSEVLQEMAQAGRIHAELSSQGRELRFVRDEQGGRTRVEVRDRVGNVLKTLSPAQALAVAAGAPLE